MRRIQRLAMLVLGLGALASGCFSAPPPTRPAMPPPLPAFAAPPEELARVVAKSVDGFAPEGAPLEGSLDAFQPLSLGLKRGECYVLVVHLAPGAEFSEHAKRGVDFLFRNAGDISGGEINSGPGVVGPGGVATIGCPQHDAAAQFDLRASLNVYRDPSHAHDLGRGSFSAQLYSKVTTEQQLAGERAAFEKDQQDQRDTSAKIRAGIEEKQRSACATCLAAHDACIADWRRAATRETCDRERDSCLFMKGAGEHVEDCGQSATGR